MKKHIKLYMGILIVTFIFTVIGLTTFALTSKDYTTGGSGGKICVYQKLNVNGYYGNCGTYTWKTKTNETPVKVDLITAKIEDRTGGNQLYSQKQDATGATTGSIYSSGKNFRSTHKVLSDKYGNFSRLGGNGLVINN